MILKEFKVQLIKEDYKDKFYYYMELRVTMMYNNCSPYSFKYRLPYLHFWKIRRANIGKRLAIKTMFGL